MPFIKPADQEMLRELFAERLGGEVTITYFSQRESVLIVPSHECEYCGATRELLEELAALSPEKLHLEVKDYVPDEAEAQQLGITRIPAFVLSGQAKGKVRYFGVPAGYEFSGLIEDLISVSSGTTELRPETEQALAALRQDLHLQVFVTPT
jgi:alkyl hydroperoxide reductase subunit AhpF